MYGNIAIIKENRPGKRRTILVRLFFMRIKQNNAF